MYDGITVTEELSQARSVIENTQTRARTFDEMLILDKVFRPPGW